MSLPKLGKQTMPIVDQLLPVIVCSANTGLILPLDRRLSGLCHSYWLVELNQPMSENIQLAVSQSGALIYPTAST